MLIRCYVAWPHRMLHTYVFFLGGLRKDDWKNSMMVAKIAKQRHYLSFFHLIEKLFSLLPHFSFIIYQSKIWYKTFSQTISYGGLPVN